MRIECRLTLSDGSNKQEVIEAASKDKALEIMERRYGSFKSCEFYRLRDESPPEFLGRAGLLEDLEHGSTQGSRTQPVQDVGAELREVSRIPRRSNWATFLRVIAAVWIVPATKLLLVEPIFAFGAVTAGILFLFFAFLVDVFTDIRWLLMVQTTGKNREEKTGD
jgi:hypothetical protein